MEYSNKRKKTEKLIRLSNKAVATSGGYGTSFEPSIKNHHIFDTRNGKSSNNYSAVSIIETSAWKADSVSTASLSMNKNELKKVCRKLGSKSLY